MSEKEMRELDAWIAEHVMGWIYEQSKPCRKGVDTSPFAFWNCGSTSVLVSQWLPSSALASTMMVLEKCAERTIDSDCLYLGKVENGEWIVGHTPEGIEERGDTLPIAICLFAKKLFSI